MVIPDYYEILQVSRHAEPEVIEAAFKRLAFKYHPDRNHDAAAPEMMKLLNEAHDVLCDPENRKRYDRGRRHQPFDEQRPRAHDETNSSGPGKADSVPTESGVGSCKRDGVGSAHDDRELDKVRQWRNEGAALGAGMAWLTSFALAALLIFFAWGFNGIKTSLRATLAILLMGPVVCGLIGAVLGAIAGSAVGVISADPEFPKRRISASVNSVVLCACCVAFYSSKLFLLDWPWWCVIVLWCIYLVLLTASDLHKR